jgi:tellurite resistance protein
VASGGRLTNALRTLGRSCSDELDAYSRYLGRHPDQAEDPRALGLLPRELLESHTSPALEALREVTAPLVGETRIHVPGERLIEQMPAAGDKLSKKDAANLARLLASLSVGIEPDVRFGGPPPASDQSVVLYRLEHGAPDAPSSAYTLATALLNLAAAVSWADGSVSPEEEKMLAGHLAHAPELDEHERSRLAAHVDWLLASPPAMRALKERVAKFHADQRDQVALALVAIAGADGHISPDEVRVLKKDLRRARVR